MDLTSLASRSWGNDSQPSTTTRWWAHEIELRCQDREVNRWFQHHLYTSTSLVESESRSRSLIHAVVDKALTTELHKALMNGETDSVEGYVGDPWTAGKIGAWRAWARGDQGAAPDTIHLVVELEKDLWLIVGGGSATVAEAAVRIGRELLRTELARRGAYTLHAAFAVDERMEGLLFVGPSGVGKTTLALATARDKGYLVSSDQSELLTTAGGAVCGVGFPWVARIGFGTLVGLGRERAIEATPLLRRQPAIVDGKVIADARAFLSSTKVELTMLELDVLLDVPTAACASVRAVVLIGPEAGGRVQVQPASWRDVAKELEEQSREPDPAFAVHWLARPGELLPGRPISDLRRVLAGIPLLRLAWNPEADSPADALAGIKGTLSGI